MIKRITIEALLLFFNALRFLKSFLTAFFSVLLKPILFILHKIFLKIFIKIYLGGFSFFKKIGADNWRGNFISFIFNRRTIHILAIVLVIAVSAQSFLFRAGVVKALSENAGKTMLSGLITKEFYGEEESGLIEEYFNGNIPQVQSKYLDDSSLLANNNGVDFNIQYEDNPSIENDDVLVKPDLSTTEISKKTRKGEVEYIVQPGDFDVTVNTILWENSLTAYSLIRPGDKLTILPDTGVSHKVAKGETLGSISAKYGVEADDILAVNDLSDDSMLAVGKKLFIPGGRPYSVPVAAPKTTVVYNPITVIKDLINPSAKDTPANKMFWPAQGRITQYFTWRHHGLDIANKQGTPIYAADAGVVTDAGWNTAGYGNKVDIDHGGGKMTRYGHFYKILVKKGDKVERGQVIGLMGTTGNSTGPHLHFEVRINNVTYNPLDYIK